MSKDVRQLLHQARRQGLAVRLGGSGLYRVTGPSGKTVSVPGTPRGGRGLHATRRALRRIGADL